LYISADKCRCIHADALYLIIVKTVDYVLQGEKVAIDILEKNLIIWIERDVIYIYK
jgi:hypothetical protein